LKRPSSNETKGKSNKKSKLKLKSTYAKAATIESESDDTSSVTNHMDQMAVDDNASD
jgi:hypothetical protein